MLVIACPHALGLAIPLVIAISTERAARAGVLVKDRLALERMRTVDAVLFDKTGTLTAGAASRHRRRRAPAASEAELLALAAAAEADSEHPLARAIVARRPAPASAARRAARLPLADRAAGCEATVDGATVAVGGPALLRERGSHRRPSSPRPTGGWVARGATVLHVVGTGRSSARSRSRTRSGPSPGRRSTRCTRAG